MLGYQQPPHIYEAKIPPSSGNNPTPLKTPDFKGFYSSRFAIDSNMTAKNIEDALLFTAEHLFYAFSQFGFSTKPLSLKSLINLNKGGIS
mgnify:CR=1 FL=1